MSRPLVVTRTAVEDDLAALVNLAGELSELGGRAERAVNPLGAGEGPERLLAVLSEPNCRVVVALEGEVPVGFALLKIHAPDPLSDAQIVDVTHLFVDRARRHRGVGHALMAAAADFAGERRVDHVAVSAYPSLRDTIRFFARLGFAPMTVRRVAPVSVLRRRVSVESGGQAARRRRARLLRPAPPAPKHPGPVEAVDQ